MPSTIFFLNILSTRVTTSCHKKLGQVPNNGTIAISYLFLWVITVQTVSKSLEVLPDKQEEIMVSIFSFANISATLSSTVRMLDFSSLLFKKRPSTKIFFLFM